MILFFGDPTSLIIAVQTSIAPSDESSEKLSWLFGGMKRLEVDEINQFYIGPRAAMITPWSTNAVDITQNMNIEGIERIERFKACQKNSSFDPMIFEKYPKLSQQSFTIDIESDKIKDITNISAYNEQEGLALNAEEVTYLENLSKNLGRPLTDSEVFGFSQVNSEHCRHKIFNGTFVIDGNEMEASLFSMIKETSKQNSTTIVSAYKDNVAFVGGPTITQFAPKSSHIPDYYEKKKIESVLSLKAETHNFPTTVEPFNGAATGSGGEIRDRLAGGIGSLPLAGTAVYMTSYSRLKKDKSWEQFMPPRPWLYQTPIDILIKASNGASDFGNKFGQPLICGSLLTFEHEEHGRKLAYDKVIMLAGGIGYAKAEHAKKSEPAISDKIVILGGDNYRIGMGGAAVSSADTGEFSSGIELNAVQRSNPEMQKRVANTIRGMVEVENNPIVSIHDHGAGGHLNCLSELVEDTGGKIDLAALPIGDKTLSAKELIGNESQERMGLIIPQKDLSILSEIAARERSPMYVVGEVTGDHKFIFESSENGEKPIDLELKDFFGSSPKTILRDRSINRVYKNKDYHFNKLEQYLENVLRLEGVACKDWLTNKVDRCVGGRVAKQQCAGPLQLPLNDVAVMALDFDSSTGIATSIGHSPISGLINAEAGARCSIAESLTNLIFAPIENGIKGVSLSANWMWPARNEGEDARLYKAVKAVSEFSIALGINVPTGKDSMSMKQKYRDEEVLSPGTVIISTIGNCTDINQVVEPVFSQNGGDIYYINFSAASYQLGGSSFAQSENFVGENCPDINDPDYFITAFNAVQKLIKTELISAGHDISAGGMITTLLEMCFSNPGIGATIDFGNLEEADTIKLLFSENAGIILQSKNNLVQLLEKEYVHCMKIGTINNSSSIKFTNGPDQADLKIDHLRDVWYETSYLLDQKQSGPLKAKERYQNYKNQVLNYSFPSSFTGELPVLPRTVRPKAAVIREQGSNSERELAHALYLAGFDVKDVHMTDLISGRENLEDIRFIGAVGGFSNSDVLGSAKGWAGSFKYNDKAKEALDNFFKREDVLSIGICNGCQLFTELNLINPEHEQPSKMLYNDSKKHESSFTSVKIQKNNSVLLSSLEGSTLGVWISHGEGKFHLPHEESMYNIVGKYGYDGYPANPNGSTYNTAMISSPDGRHLITMPHIERSIFQWNWAHYPEGRKDQVSPWLEAFVNARKWIEEQG